MGSLAGHALPGAFFLLHGLWWAVLSIWTKLKTRNVGNINKYKKNSKHVLSFFDYKRDHRLARKSWIPLPCYPQIPLEPVLKVFFPLVGILVEAFLDYRRYPANKPDLHLTAVVYYVISNGELNSMDKLHHITMYSAFLISGIVDLVSLFLKLPRQASQIVFCIAFWVEWMLFYSHASENDSLNMVFHFLLNLAILSCVFFSASRVFYSSHFIVNIGLSFCIILQGTWFFQTGVSLYPPSGSNVFLTSSATHAHRVTMFVYALFTWHVLLLIIFFLLLWGLLSCCVKYPKLLKLPARLNHSEQSIDSDEQEQLISDHNARRVDLDLGIEMDEVRVNETVS